MSVLKCKMCGGDLHVPEGATTATCEYCGIVQTIPKADDEKKLLQFERAERLRKQCEFDKAAGIYESIVADFRDEAEAYWGLVLCKYGIEYVDDPATGRKVPTCHRSGYESVFKDPDFEQALENAGPIARQLYRGEAKKIEELRKEIIAVSANEEPYDIFICYKETDLNGNRTLDSVLAQDIYDALTDKGYRVFFSRISLEDKLGQAYEPYIFAALHSAKVMLAVGTGYEHYNAVWVKNEWSRFLKLTVADKTKHLIPCYKNIDAYGMPEEFAHLQAQDLGKVGAIQDLLRGIEKLLSRKDATTVVKETVVVSGTPSGGSAPTSHLERAFMFLELGDGPSIVKARAFLRDILNREPKNAQAYLGQLMADLRVRKMEEIAHQNRPLEGNINFQRAMQFGDAKLRATLTDYAVQIEKRNTQERLRSAYNRGTAIMNSDRISDVEEAIKLFESIPDYKDALEKIDICKQKLETLKSAKTARKEKAKATVKKIGRITIITASVACVIAVSVLLIIYFFIPNSKYNDAKEVMNAGRYKEAIAAFDELNGFRKSEDFSRSAYQLHKASDLKNAKIGDTIFFGTYTDDCLGYKIYDRDGHLEWFVLDKKDGKLLVISKYTLGFKSYDDDPYLRATWETCSLREWLNNRFFNTIFSADEQAMIPTVTVPAEPNPNYDTYPGNDTQDKVFILSINEVSRYFGSDAARQTYDGLPGALDDGHSSSFDSWWLRNPGENTSTAAYVKADGSLSIKGYEHEGFPQVRPAMWIDLGN